LGPDAAGAGEALSQASRTGEAVVREHAMRAIVMIQPPEALDAFTAGLKDASVDVRVLASAGLLQAEDVPVSAGPALIESLRDPEVRVRANAANALARLDSIPGEAVSLLIDCVAEPNDALRLAAANALKKAPPEVVADVMVHLTTDPNSRIRLTAASSLLAQDADDPEAGAVLAEALEDSAPRVREEAQEILESLGDDDETVLEAQKEDAPGGGS